MLEFTKLTLDDIEKIRPYFLYSSNRACDDTVGGTFIWRDYFSAEYALFSNTYISKVNIRYQNGITAFTFPLGEDVIGSIEEIECYCSAVSIPVAFCKVTQAELPLLKTVFSNTRLMQESNWGDYLYRADDLISLSGKKFHGQKNHLNYFRRTYANYSFEDITKSNIGEVIDFYKSLDVSTQGASDIFVEDHIKTLEVLDNYDVYGMPGGLIRVDGNVAAFAIGEVRGDTLYVHVEKADMRYRGLYQAINNEYARRYVSDGVEYINREDDAGDPGLRIAKRSYHPVELIDKYIVEVVE